MQAVSQLTLNLGYGTSANNGNLLSQQIVILGSLDVTQQYQAYDGVNRLKWAAEDPGKVGEKIQRVTRRLLRQTAAVTTIKARSRADNGSQPDWVGESGVVDSARLLEASCVRNQNSQRVGRTEAVLSATGRNMAC